MSEKKDLQFVFQEIANHNIKARDIVEKCAQTSDDESKKMLSLYIKSIEKGIKLISYDNLKKLTSVVHRGFKFKSEQAGALKYFYFGYYARAQEEILKQAEEYYQRIKISEIASKKHFNSIMSYLSNNGISRQRDISHSLHINKSNLSRILDEVVEYKLANKIVGPKVVFYELTATGYKYCKTHNLSNEIINRKIWLDNERVLAYRKSQFNYYETKVAEYEQIDTKWLLADDNCVAKAKFESKIPFTEHVSIVEPHRCNLSKRTSLIL